MLVTTKGRYAMRLMIRIAQQGPDGKVPLRKVAEEEDISLKYLEQVVRPLMAAGLVRSVRGKGGGYALAREASEIRAGDVLRAAEGSHGARGVQRARGRRDRLPAQGRVHDGALLGGA